MNDEHMALLVDLHIHQKRQGPGSEEQTEKAIKLANLDKSKKLRIADIGCGTGAVALQLAQSLNAKVTAVDFLPAFIEVLKDNSESQGFSESINPLVCSMEKLPFSENEFDVIWSEGAIYNMGFENGVRYWKQFIKPGGILAVSEITWITGSRPKDIEEYWVEEYPEVGTASSKFRVLEDHGYSPVGYFVLPEECWLENYYRPIHDHIPEFLKRHDGNKIAASIIDAKKKEVETYRKYKSYYSYGFYIARKISSSFRR